MLTQFVPVVPSVAARPLLLRLPVERPPSYNLDDRQNYTAFDSNHHVVAADAHCALLCMLTTWPFAMPLSVSYTHTAARNHPAPAEDEQRSRKNKLPLCSHSDSMHRRLFACTFMPVFIQAEE